MWTCIFDWLNRNAAAIQAVGSVGAILAAIAVGWWHTLAARRSSDNDRNRSARVLAMELLPIVVQIHRDLSHSLRMGWANPDHWQIKAIQDRELNAPDDLEKVLPRLVVFDEETVSSVLNMLSAIREYRRAQTASSLLAVIQDEVGRELNYRRRILEDAEANAVKAESRLAKIAGGEKNHGPLYRDIKCDC